MILKNKELQVDKKRFSLLTKKPTATAHRRE